MFSNAIDRMPAAFLDRCKVIRLDTPSIVYLAVAGTKPLHASSNSEGRPINFFDSAGQVNDYIRERALLSSLPDLDWLLGDWGATTPAGTVKPLRQGDKRLHPRLETAKDTGKV